MSKIMTFIKKHSVLTYFALTFAISWGGILLVIGPGGILGTKEISEELMLFIYMAPLLGPSVAGILLTGLIYGKAGFRELLSSLLRWRVGARWYTVALLITPLLTITILLTLSLTSPAFLPPIFISDNKVSLLLIGIVAGLMVAFFEELGWTAFAVPQLRLRYSVLNTGIIVGVLWGLWHLPLFSGSAGSSGLPPALYLVVVLFSWLPPYRVLMVWVYDRTKSLLVVMLMHVPIVVSQSVLISPAMSGAQVVTYDLIFAATIWVSVAAVYRWMKTLPRQGRETSLVQG